MQMRANCNARTCKGRDNDVGYNYSNVCTSGYFVFHNGFDTATYVQSERKAEQKET